MLGAWFGSANPRWKTAPTGTGWLAVWPYPTLGVGFLLRGAFGFPGFDRPEVGTLPGEGTPVFEGRKPRSPPILHLLIELLLAGIAQIRTNQLEGQTFAIA